MIIASSLISFLISLEALAVAGPSPEYVETKIAQLETVEPLPVPLFEETTPELSADDVLDNINARMADTKTAKGGFSQTDAMGNITTGDFYLRRPGRVRFEYTAPSPILIVSDGTTVAIEDKSLETLDRAPLAATPLKHFLKKNLDLAEDTNVLDVKTLPEFHLVVIEDNPKDGRDAIDGLVYLKFEKETFDLNGWVTIDGLGNETRVDLIDMEHNVKISPRLFILEDQDDRDRR